MATDVSTADSAQRLLAILSEMESCVIAFSGGVDSAVVACAAYQALGSQSLAVTGVSASLAAGERETAARVAQAIGISHREVSTPEFDDDGYVANQPSRCWHCKDNLYEELKKIAEEVGAKWIVNGANGDDAHDFRPGMKAATEHEVRSPLAECDFDKASVREIAQLWELEVWDKPATPCLSSRVVYGLEVTPERLARIDKAESLLRELGLSTVRVRLHHEDLARIEVPLAELPVFCQDSVRDRAAEELRKLGFRYITLDIEGFRSGSFQQLVSVEELAKFHTEQ